MNASHFELCALLSAAFAGPLLARRAPLCEPHARVATACLALYLVRALRPHDVSLGVFLFVVWPGLAGALVVHVLPMDPPASPEAPLANAVSCGAEGPGPGPGFGGGQPPSFLSSRVMCVLASFMVAATALATEGHRLCVVWPWPLFTAQAASVVLAVEAWGRRARSGISRSERWAQVGAVVLPAGTLADLATVWAGAPDTVRAVLGGVTWLLFGATMAACSRTAQTPPAARAGG